MNKLIVSLLLAASLAVPSAAMAAAPAAKPAAPKTMTTTGPVLAVSTKFCTVALANMGTYVFAKNCKLSKITAGEWVTITWWAKGNLREATKIVVSKPMTPGAMMKARMSSMMKH